MRCAWDSLNLCDGRARVICVAVCSIRTCCQIRAIGPTCVLIVAGWTDRAKKMAILEAKNSMIGPNCESGATGWTDRAQGSPPDSPHLIRIGVGMVHNIETLPGLIQVAFGPIGAIGDGSRRTLVAVGTGALTIALERSHTQIKRRGRHAQHRSPRKPCLSKEPQAPQQFR